MRREQGRSSNPSCEFADESQVSVDGVPPTPGAIAIQPVGGNSDLAVETDHLNAMDANALICVNNEESRRGRTSEASIGDEMAKA